MDTARAGPAGTSSCPHLIATDERRVREILGHLLSNALKYTPEHGRVWMRIGAHLDTGHAEAHVATAATVEGMSGEVAATCLQCRFVCPKWDSQFLQGGTAEVRRHHEEVWVPTTIPCGERESARSAGSRFVVRSSKYSVQPKMK